MTGMIPEVVAAEKIADLLDKHQDPRWFTPAALQYLGRKVVGYRNAIRPILDELDADPKRLPDRGFVLRQQSSQSYDGQDAILERLYEIERERLDLYGQLAAMGSPYARDLDVDERGEREDDARISRDRQDEDAAAGMPKGIAS